jgi:two-component system CheB/CheR fusion protein
VLEGLDRRGRPITCRARISPLLDEAGDRHGAVMLFQDITEERRNEDYSRYLGRVMDAALGEICFLDPDTLAFKQVNEPAQRGLGYSQAQLANMNLLELVEGPGTDVLRARLEALFAGDEEQVVLPVGLRTQEGVRPTKLSFRYFSKEVPPVLMATFGDAK